MLKIIQIFKTSDAFFVFIILGSGSLNALYSRKNIIGDAKGELTQMVFLILEHNGRRGSGINDRGYGHAMG